MLKVIKKLRNELARCPIGPMMTDASRARIQRAEIGTFAFPHLVVDDLFPAHVLETINRLWPDRSAFQPEVPGISIAFNCLKNQRGKTLAFWRQFSGAYWPAIIAACAERFSHITDRTRFRLPYEDTALALMDADDNFAGHGRHHHFYHNPNWILTALFYADTEDTNSPGTTLSHLLDGDPAEVSLKTLQWGAHSFADLEIAYKPNRLFVFLDGPMAFHSVVTKRPQTGRRRILRTHLAVDWRAFATASGLGNIDRSEYVQMMMADERPASIVDFTRRRVAEHAAASNDTALA